MGHSGTDHFGMFDRRYRASIDKARIAPSHSILHETQRELAVFASDMMGAQSHVGQYGSGRLKAEAMRQLRDLIELSPRACMIVDPRPGLRVIDMSLAFAVQTMTDRNRTAGEKLFDVFPDNPALADADGVSKLFESLKQAAQTGRPHQMPLQRYDVRNAAGVFVERYWRPVNHPIFDDAGRLIGLLHESINVSSGALTEAGAD